MAYVGVDHSTTGVKVGIVAGGDPREAFTLDRAELGDGSVSLLDELSSRVALDDVDLAAVTYSWGDAVSAVTPVEDAPNRGVEDHIGAGYELGGGTVAYDELADSDVPAVVIPGVHRDLPNLHPYFSHYSALAGGDKVADVRYAQEVMARGGDPDEFIWACASSSCMAGLVTDGQLRGFFHWMGMMHGWPDPEALREAAAGVESVDDLLMRCGVLHRSGAEFDDIRETPDRDLLEMAYWATVHNVYSLVPFARELGGGDPDGVVLAGRLMHVEEPFDVRSGVEDHCESIAPTYLAPEYSAAYGAAHVARDAATGADDVLGIPVADGVREVVA